MLNFIKKIPTIIKGFYLALLKKNQDLYTQRYSKCKTCPAKLTIAGEEKCGICGCFLKAKLVLPEEQCPSNPPRWLRVINPNPDVKKD